MKPVRLIHWNPAEAQALAGRLEALGYAVEYRQNDVMQLLRNLRQETPLAVVIDLSRLPSQGRDVAVAIRQIKVTRPIPLVFVGGAAEKVERVRQLLPDAVYTTWETIGPALAQAIENPPVNPVGVESRMAGYAGQPLVKKLGIKPGMRVSVMDGPADFAALVGDLPEGALLVEGWQAGCGLVVWFIRDVGDLLSNVAWVAGLPGSPGIWMAWPKKGSLLASDLTQQMVREAGLANGLVDYKVCAIDDTWSGLLFTRRKK